MAKTRVAHSGNSRLAQAHGAAGGHGSHGEAPYASHPHSPVVERLMPWVVSAVLHLGLLLLFLFAAFVAVDPTPPRNGKPVDPLTKALDFNPNRPALKPGGSQGTDKPDRTNTSSLSGQLSNDRWDTPSITKDSTPDDRWSKNDAKVENVKAMTDFTREYGVY